VTRALLTLAGAVIVAVLAASPAGASVELTMNRPRVSTRLGATFMLETTIANTGRSPLTGLIAHLNVVSLTPDVYVDPEDWSSERTQYLHPIDPSRSLPLTWKVKAVNGGDFAIYVVALHKQSDDVAGQPVAASPAVSVHATEHRTLDTGRALPVVLLIPGLVAAVWLTLVTRRRRLMKR
jgi:hypothetical protein